MEFIHALFLVIKGVGVMAENEKYPKIIDGWGAILILFVVSACVTLTLCAILNVDKSTLTFLSYTISFGSVAFVLAAFQSRCCALKFRDLYKKFDWRVLPFCFVFVVGVGYAIFFVMNFIPVPDILRDIVECDMKINLQTFLLICIVAPFLEELIFRGIFLRSFLCNYSVGKALFWSSLFFALAHLNPWQFVEAFCVGYFIGWLFMRTASLWLAIAVHALNNLISFLLAAVGGLDMHELLSKFSTTANVLFSVIGVVLALFSVYMIKRVLGRAEKLS